MEEELDALHAARQRHMKHARISRIDHEVMAALHSSSEHRHSPSLEPRRRSQPIVIRLIASVGFEECDELFCLRTERAVRFDDKRNETNSFAFAHLSVFALFASFVPDCGALWLYRRLLTQRRD